MLPGPLTMAQIAVIAAAPADDPVIDAVVLHVRGLAGDDLLRDLELRSPGLTITLQAPGDAPQLPADRRWAYVLVRAADEGAVLTVILADGRAYDRSVAAGPDQAARAAASALANLLAAIAEDRVAPDREDVTPAAALPDAASEPAPAPAPASSPAEPASASEPASAGTTPTADASPSARASPEPDAAARPSIIPELAPLVAAQLGPPTDAGALGGGGLSVGLGLRTAAGARVGLDLRPLWNARGGLSLHRYRVALRGGYELRRGRFALTTDALVGVEPWLARVDGRRVEVGRSAADLAPGLALALGLRVAPAIDLKVTADDRPRLRLGLWAELTYTGVVDQGLRAARITLPDGASDRDARLRLGGVEATFGLLVALPLALGRPR